MRQSNFELLRIVSMLMVLAVHIDGASLGLPEPLGCVADLTARDWWRLGVESIAIIGVNCFTLISGYFGIRLTRKGMVRFLSECLIYSVGLYVVALAAKPAGFSLGALINSALILTHTDLWYVPAYFILMLLAPLINAGVEKLTRRQLTELTLLLTALTVWCGWWWGGKFNPTGYTPLQLVYVYVIGRWIRLYAPDVRSARAVWSAAWAASVAMILVSALWLPSLKAFAYNSPFVLLATVSLFMLFRTVSFTSRTVNWLASSAFAVYLIHKTPVVWGGVMRPTVVKLWTALSLPEFTLAAIALMTGIYLACAIVDSLRRKAFTLFKSTKA